ncbi:MAG TPA: hypothetical protein VII16_08485 [Actinomycetes bacterium]
MRFLRPHPLDILLGLAILSLLGFVYWRERLDAESPWLDLWPNITVDLFSVWLVARIIEAFITSREQRRDAALDVRGAMNFTMQRVNDVLPDAYPWTIRSLRDEAGWMRINAERRDLALNDALRHIMRSGAHHLDAIITGAETLRSALLDVQRTRGPVDDAFRDAHEADRSHAAQWGIRSLDGLLRTWDIARDLEIEEASSELHSAVEAVRRDPPSPAGDARHPSTERPPRRGRARPGRTQRATRKHYGVHRVCARARRHHPRAGDQRPLTRQSPREPTPSNAVAVGEHESFRRIARTIGSRRARPMASPETGADADGRYTSALLAGCMCPFLRCAFFLE